MNNIIEIEIKGKKFNKNKKTILNNFIMKVKYGEMISIIGESGVGKSSLLNIIGLLDKTYEGTYKLFGSDVSDLSQKKLAKLRNKKIGFVLQESALIHSMTIEENIKLPLIYANMEKNSSINDYFERIVKKIGIESILKKRPLECSGGQKARAAFARALIMTPQIILADEPTASLDIENKEKIMDLLFELNKEFNTTIITVTHDINLANSHGRVISLEGSSL